MAEIRQTWVLDTGPLIAALQNGNRSVEETSKLIEELGKQLDTSFQEGGEAADDAAEKVDGLGDSAQEAGDKGKEGSEAFADGLKGIGVAAAAAAAAIGLVVASAVDFSASANEIAKHAATVGETAESYQVLDGAFQLLTDGSVNVQMALVKLNRNLDEAREGAGPAADALARLGLEADVLAKMPAADRIAAIADEVAKLDDRAAQTAISIDLLGRAGFTLVPAMENGGDAIRDAAAEFASAGVVSNELAAQSEVLQDEILLLGQQFGMLKSQFLEPLIPRLTETAVAIRGVIAEAENTGAIDDLAESLNLLFTNETAADANAFTEALVFLARTFTILVDAQKLVFDLSEALSAAFSDNLGITNKWDKKIGDVVETAKRLGQNLGILDAAEKNLVGTTRELTDVIDEETAAINDQLLGVLASLDSAYDDTGASAKKAAADIEEVTESVAVQAVEVANAWEGYVPSVEDATTEAERVWSGHAQAVTDISADTVAEFQRFALDTTTTALDMADSIAGAISEVFAIAAADAINAVQGTQDEIDRITELMINTTDQAERERLRLKRAALEEQLKDEKKAALDAWRVSQGAAAASAGVATALAVVQALASPVPFPVAVGFAIAAGVIGGLQIGLIDQASPPSFHTGGLLSDELMVKVRNSEAILTGQGVRAAGGAAGVDALNSGNAAGGRPAVAVWKIDHKVMGASMHSVLRERDARTQADLDRIQPRTGRGLPMAWRSA